ncbi:uncharacterized protein BDR25DRAFT_270529 [Lindgomyces ingoldianus]|uniref:Uncharacterized protein n=1 Tax=Lindgomyces ingoldianus TaxID=673940 RepID=A0ACB6QG55_9PLEO|nr:uncharacterized protein BDR25DRAFT_270529 [Lindgomyces ingoldianus]KAF2465342.1 hypothetical protein BDR25DRAFT_270529 [Lindgomyces ingoldianus]
MTKRKRQYPTLQQKLDRPWCYYCERDFDDLKILISHQKAKHFKCDKCNRRLNTAGGLSVHMNQVHKENLTKVENANPDRQSLDIEIFGMEGIPAEVVDQHNQEVTSKHFAEEQERARLTGNPVHDAFGAGGQLAKKQKVEETIEGIKKRIVEFKENIANGGMQMNGSGGPVQPIGSQPPLPHLGHSQPTASLPAIPGGPSPPPANPFAAPQQAPQQQPQHPFPPAVPQALPPRPPGHPNAALVASVDELISSAAKDAKDVKDAKEGKAGGSSKKEKNIRLVFSGDTESPEERMVRLGRFEFAA